MVRRISCLVNGTFLLCPHMIMKQMPSLCIYYICAVFKQNLKYMQMETMLSILDKQDNYSEVPCGNTVPLF